MQKQRGVKNNKGGIIMACGGKKTGSKKGKGGKK